MSDLFSPPVVTLGDCTIHNGDMLQVIAGMPENSIDGVLTDPPYHLSSVTKRLGKPGSAPIVHGTDGAYARAARGFMGKEWDGGDIAFRPDTWRTVLRVMKPGAHMLVFGGSRTAHRMFTAIEDAGFNVRDSIAWIYGSGHPKLPVIVQRFDGYAIAVKPSHEPIALFRKDLDGSTNENVWKWATGALNIDGCRFGADNRFPGNVIHDGSILGDAARYFYHVKADRADRNGSNHPTVKPINLLRYLLRLIMPPGGTVLDSFAGTGTTLAAARLEGFRSIGVERDVGYFLDIKRRMQQ